MAYGLRASRNLRQVCSEVRPEVHGHDPQRQTQAATFLPSSMSAAPDVCRSTGGASSTAPLRTACIGRQMRIIRRSPHCR